MLAWCERVRNGSDVMGVFKTYAQAAEAPKDPVADFEKAVLKVLKREGGYVDDPVDRGGATNYGITISTLTAWRKSQAKTPEERARLVTKDDVRKLTVTEAKEIYRERYWKPMNLDGLHEFLAEALFDQAVNFGIGGASRRVQQTLNRAFKKNVTVDGQIGPMSKAALLTVPWRKFLKEFICETQDAYVRIVIANPPQMRFLAGWINRSQELMDYLI